MRQPHGQNFLVEKNIARKIVSAAGIAPDDRVFEIGPGKGVLSALIAPLTKDYTAVEIDKALFEGLKNRFERQTNVHFILADFLNYPFSSETGPLKIVANLPYNVSTAIIAKFLPGSNWTTAIVMVQKEAGERLLARPGTKDYGYFTVFCRYHAKCEKLFTVGPGCFFPKPRVDSVVLKFTNLFADKLDPGLNDLIKAAFLQRRKTALNSITSALKLPKIDVLQAFERSGIDIKLRPEDIGLDQFARLYKNLPFSSIA